MLMTRNAEAQKEIKEFGLEPIQLMVIPAVFVGIISLLLPLRIYVRAKMLRSYGLDDWLLLNAFVCKVVCHAISVLTCQCSSSSPSILV